VGYSDQYESCQQHSQQPPLNLVPQLYFHDHAAKKKQTKDMKWIGHWLNEW
jgi:hypothetical protein